MPEDYEVNDRVSVLFLSLKYHIAYPLYVVGRLEELYKMRRNKNRILQVLADHQDDQNTINGLTIQCLKFEVTLILCWSFEEAAQYIQTMKSYENKTQTLLEGKFPMMQAQQTHLEQASEALTNIRRINKTDAKNLLQNYGSLKAVIEADNYEEFLNIDGIGQQKIETLSHCFKGKFHQHIVQPKSSAPIEDLKPE